MIYYFENEKMGNGNFFNTNFAKARSQSFCFLQYIENWKKDLIESHGHKRFCFLQYINF